MKKLARNFRKSSSDDDDEKFSLPTSDDSRPIDTQEQEEIVRSFEQAEARQSRIWRVVFAGLVCCFVLFLLYSIFEQASNPWELRYHAYFMKEIDSKTVILADWFAIFSCLLAIVGLVHSSNHRKRWIWFSFLSGILLAVFWLNYMLRLAKFRWDVIWLPFGPLRLLIKLEQELDNHGLLPNPCKDRFVSVTLVPETNPLPLLGNMISHFKPTDLAIYSKVIERQWKKISLRLNQKITERSLHL